MKTRLLRYWLYFKNGHGHYLSFFLSFANFIVIQYKLLVETIPFLESLVKTLTFFSLLFLAIYIPVCTVIGWMDLKRGTGPVHATIQAQISPYIRDFTRAIYLMLNDEKEEAEKLLRKWGGW